MRGKRRQPPAAEIGRVCRAWKAEDSNTTGIGTIQPPTGQVVALVPSGSNAAPVRFKRYRGLTFGELNADAVDTSWVVVPERRMPSRSRPENAPPTLITTRARKDLKTGDHTLLVSVKQSKTKEKRSSDLASFSLSSIFIFVFRRQVCFLNQQITKTKIRSEESVAGPSYLFDARHYCVA